MDLEIGCIAVDLWCINFQVYLLQCIYAGQCNIVCARKNGHFLKICVFSDHEYVLCVQFTAEKQHETGQALYYSSIPHQPARHNGVSHRQRWYLLPKYSRFLAKETTTFYLVVVCWLSVGTFWLLEDPVQLSKVILVGKIFIF
jgi:hypothetical protein